MRLDAAHPDENTAKQAWLASLHRESVASAPHPEMRVERRFAALEHRIAALEAEVARLKGQPG